MLAWLVGAAHAGPAGCELNKVAPARVVTKEPRLQFVAGGGERTPGCPSAASACRLRAYVMPGDEVLVDLTDGAYVCAFFKSQGGMETRGWLPRASLELVAPTAAPGAAMGRQLATRPGSADRHQVARRRGGDFRQRDGR